MTLRQRLEQLARHSLTEEDCPPAEQVASYALGLLEGTDALRVAAHLRSCPLCSADILAARPPAPRRSPILAQLLPVAWLEGRRGDTASRDVRQFVAADLTIELTIARPQGDHWRITGQIIRDETGVADVLVTLRNGRRTFQQAADADGFFTFGALRTGTYTLSAIDEATTVEIRDLILQH